ncbi:Uncharacterised protein [Klebsiella pneumoniae subsp. ozaenae]|uniref:Uncharacterized protein n=1 Tax=Klebsiella pneumoniae subsp. ozaenae TaxID=574 RepID=A0A378AM58_KLEPO|nr:Uncharacterised protein [Klebsiella pneumoniae subsp. ozaenae]
MAWSLFLCCERSFWHCVTKPGRDMGNTHRGFRTVNVLTTGAGGAVYVNAQVGRVNFDIDIVFHFRVNERRAEGGMTAAAESNGLLRTRR